MYFRNVAMGYFLNEEKTKEDFYEEDGFRWFRTGIKLFSQIIFEKYIYLHFIIILKLISRKKR